MSRQLPEPGTYTGRRHAAIIVNAEESGALMVYIPYILSGSNFVDEHALCIGTKNGQVMERNWETLRKAFPAWTSANPFDLESIPMPEGEEAEFELADCFHDDTYVPEGKSEPIIQFKAKWFNALGGGRSRTPLDEAKKKEVMTKWGGRFRALSGGGSAAPVKAAEKQEPAKAPTVTAPKAPAKSAPPQRRAGSASSAAKRTATQQEVWEAFEAQNAGKSQEELAGPYWDAINKIAPDKNGELTASQWGEVAVELGV